MENLITQICLEIFEWRIKVDHKEAVCLTGTCYASIMKKAAFSESIRCGTVVF